METSQVSQHFTQTPVADAFEPSVAFLLVHSQIYETFTELLADMVDQRRVVAGPSTVKVAEIHNNTAFDGNNGLVAVDVSNNRPYHGVAHKTEIGCIERHGCFAILESKINIHDKLFGFLANFLLTLFLAVVVTASNN